MTYRAHSAARFSAGQRAWPALRDLEQSFYKKRQAKMTAIK